MEYKRLEIILRAACAIFTIRDASLRAGGSSSISGCPCCRPLQETIASRRITLALWGLKHHEPAKVGAEKYLKTAKFKASESWLLLEWPHKSKFLPDPGGMLPRRTPNLLTDPNLSPHAVSVLHVLGHATVFSAAGFARSVHANGKQCHCKLQNNFNARVRSGHAVYSAIARPSSFSGSRCSWPSRVLPTQHTLH